MGYAVKSSYNEPLWSKTLLKQTFWDWNLVISPETVKISVH